MTLQHSVAMAGGPRLTNTFRFSIQHVTAARIPRFGTSGAESQDPTNLQHMDESLDSARIGMT